MSIEVDTHEVEEKNHESYHLDLEYLKKKCYNKEKLTELENMCLIFVKDKKIELEELKQGDEWMRKAINKLEEISMDEKIIGLYDAEAVERKVWNTKLLYARKLGLQKGMEKGIKQGMEKGIEQTHMEVIKNMMKEGFSDSMIMKINNLSKKEFQCLKNNL